MEANAGYCKLDNAFSGFVNGKEFICQLRYYHLKKDCSMVLIVKESCCTL
jgi:hypothetical protein